MDTAAAEECVRGDEEGIGSFVRKRRKGGVNLSIRADVDGLDLEPEDARGVLYPLQCAFGVLSLCGIDENGNTNGLRHQFMQESQAAWRLPPG